MSSRESPAVLRDGIVVSAVGIASSLGGWMQACAAARAGLSRSTELDRPRHRAAADGNVTGTTAHPASTITLGFERFARLIALARHATADLLKSGSIGACDARRAGLFVGLPHVDRTSRAMHLIRDPDLRARRSSEVSQDFRQRAEQGMTRVGDAMAQVIGVPIPLDRREYFPRGHSAFAHAAVAATARIRRRHIDRAIVGGFDSLLDLETLCWLKDTLRLKNPSNPVGLQPGEAGTVAVLERESESAHSATCAEVNVFEATDPDNLFAGRNPKGTGLFVALRTSLTDRPALKRECWMITDQNGEPHRASEWALAALRLRQHVPEFDPSLWYPATCFGDTGAASGGIGLAMAVHAFRRGYAPSQQAIIASSADDESRTVTVVSARKGTA